MLSYARCDRISPRQKHDRPSRAAGPLGRCTARGPLRRVSYGPHPLTEEQVSLVKMTYAAGVQAAQNLQHTTTPGRYYTDTFLNSDRHRVQRMMATAKRLGFRYGRAES